MPSRNFWRTLIAIVVIALAVRVWVTAHYQGFSSPPDAEANPDQVDYEALGWRLASGDGFTRADGRPTAFRPPGAPVLIETVYVVCGRDRAAVRIVFCLVSALTCLLAGLLGREVFGELAGLFAAMLLALLPNHVYYAQHMLSEAPYAFAITLACLWAARSRQERGHWLYDLGAGFLLGLAFLTRPQAALCLPLLGLLALFGPTRSRRAALWQFGRAAAAFALIVAPWLVRNQVELGTFAPSTSSGDVFFGAHNPVIAADPDRVGSWMRVDSLVDAQHPLPEDEVARSAACWGHGLAFLREHPGEIPRLFFWKLVRQYSPFQWTPNRLVYWSFALAWTLVAPLCLLGIWIGWRRARGSVLLLCVPMLSTFATGLLFYGCGRFRDAEAGLYVVFAAAALAALAPRAWKSWAGESVPAA